MKSRLAGLLASVLLVTVAMAEPPMRPPGLGIDRLTVLLDFNDTQKAAVQQVLEEEHKTAQADREQAMASGVRPTHEEMKAKHDARRQALRARLEPILTATQLTKFDALTQPPPMRKHPGE